MLLSRRPYLSASIQKTEKLLRAVMKEKLPEDLFAIVLSISGKTLEIFPPVLLKQRFYRDSERKIIGLAMTRDEAESLTAELLTEAFRNGQLEDLSYLFVSEERS